MFAVNIFPPLTLPTAQILPVAVIYPPVKILPVAETLALATIVPVVEINPLEVILVNVPVLVIFG